MHIDKNQDPCVYTPRLGKSRFDVSLVTGILVDPTGWLQAGRQPSPPRPAAKWANSLCYG